MRAIPKVFDGTGWGWDLDGLVLPSGTTNQVFSAICEHAVNLYLSEIWSDGGLSIFLRSRPGSSPELKIVLGDIVEQTDTKSIPISEFVDEYLDEHFQEIRLSGAAELADAFELAASRIRAAIDAVQVLQ